MKRLALAGSRVVVLLILLPVLPGSGYRGHAAVAGPQRAGNWPKDSQGDAAGWAAARRLLQVQESSTAVAAPPEASPSPAPDASQTQIKYEDAPDTAAIVGGVVGGLAGLTLILAGALVFAAGSVNQWWCCARWGWDLPAKRSAQRGGRQEGGAGGGGEAGSTFGTMRTQASDFALETVGSGATYASQSLSPSASAPRGQAAEVWGVLSAAARTPDAPATASTAPTQPGSGGGPGIGGGGGPDGGGGGGARPGIGSGGTPPITPAVSFTSALTENTGWAAGGTAPPTSLTPSLTPSSAVATRGSAGMDPLAADMAWKECLIDPAKILILRRPHSQQLWRLGGGSFGQVYKALYDDVQVVAVKVLTGMNDPAQLTSFLREGRILRHCRDPNIVQFVGAACDPATDQALLVTEYMEAGDLWRALRWRDGQGHRVFGWYNRGKKVALDAARGLHYLHSHHVIHLDLKSANILLSREGRAKLADVGLAKTSLTKNYLTTVQTMGTFAWCAPEVLTGQKCDEKADIFSFGVVLWEICTGEVPARGTMRNLEVPEEAPAAIQDLCDRCMSADPKQRPTAKEIVAALEAAGAADGAPGRQRRGGGGEGRQRATGGGRRAGERGSRKRMPPDRGQAAAPGEGAGPALGLEAPALSLAPWAGEEQLGNPDTPHLQPSSPQAAQPSGAGIDGAADDAGPFAAAAFDASSSHSSAPFGSHPSPFAHAGNGAAGDAAAAAAGRASSLPEDGEGSPQNQPQQSRPGVRWAGEAAAADGEEPDGDPGGGRAARRGGATAERAASEALTQASSFYSLKNAGWSSSSSQDQEHEEGRQQSQEKEQGEEEGQQQGGPEGH